MRLVRQALEDTGLSAGRARARGDRDRHRRRRAPPATGRGPSFRTCTTLGVRIAIDDFGTGFSSLGQLRRFPVDMIKVDRSFVQGVEHDAKDAAITANLVSLAHALGLVAIAEGIESDGQLSSLRDLGCDLAQGFLFARPAPAEEVGRMLASLGDDATLAAPDPAPA